MTEWMGIITMKSNNFAYLMKEGIKGIFQHGFMSFASVFVTVACLLVIGSCAALLYNVNAIVDKETQKTQVVAYIDDSYSQAEAKSVGSKINMIENVKLATFVTRQEALDSFIAGQEDVYEGVSADTFPDRFVITLENNDLMRETVTLLESINGVAEVDAPYDLAENFGTLKYILQIISLAIVAILLVVSLMIIANTIKIAMYDRRDEIAIMKMVGATNGFIRFPFVIEGLLLGILGAALAFFAEWGLYDMLLNWIGQMESFNLLELVPFDTLLWPMVATFGAAGIFVGLFGSFTSIRKFLNV